DSGSCRKNPSTVRCHCIFHSPDRNRNDYPTTRWDPPRDGSSELERNSDSSQERARAISQSSYFVYPFKQSCNAFISPRRVPLLGEPGSTPSSGSEYTCLPPRPYGLFNPAHSGTRPMKKGVFRQPTSRSPDDIRDCGKSSSAAHRPRRPRQRLTHHIPLNRSSRPVKVGTR